MNKKIARFTSIILTSVMQLSIPMSIEAMKHNKGKKEPEPGSNITLFIKGKKQNMSQAEKENIILSTARQNIQTLLEMSEKNPHLFRDQNFDRIQGIFRHNLPYDVPCDMFTEIQAGMRASAMMAQGVSLETISPQNLIYNTTIIKDKGIIAPWFIYLHDKLMDMFMHCCRLNREVRLKIGDYLGPCPNYVMKMNNSITKLLINSVFFVAQKEYNLALSHIISALIEVLYCLRASEEKSDMSFPDDERVKGLRFFERDVRVSDLDEDDFMSLASDIIEYRGGKITPEVLATAFVNTTILFQNSQTFFRQLVQKFEKLEKLDELVYYIM